MQNNEKEPGLKECWKAVVVMAVLAVVPMVGVLHFQAKERAVVEPVGAHGNAPLPTTNKVQAKVKRKTKMANKITAGSSGQATHILNTPCYFRGGPTVVGDWRILKNGGGVGGAYFFMGSYSGLAGWDVSDTGFVTVPASAPKALYHVEYYGAKCTPAAAPPDSGQELDNYEFEVVAPCPTVTLSITGGGGSGSGSGG